MQPIFYITFTLLVVFLEPSIAADCACDYTLESRTSSAIGVIGDTVLNLFGTVDVL